MQTLSEKDANYGFGRLIDLACHGTHYGHPVVVAQSVEEHERLKALDRPETRSATEERK